MGGDCKITVNGVPLFQHIKDERHVEIVSEVEQVIQDECKKTHLYHVPTKMKWKENNQQPSKGKVLSPMETLEHVVSKLPAEFRSEFDRLQGKTKGKILSLWKIYQKLPEIFDVNEACSVFGFEKKTEKDSFRQRIIKLYQSNLLEVDNSGDLLTYLKTDYNDMIIVQKLIEFRKQSTGVISPDTKRNKPIVDERPSTKEVVEQWKSVETKVAEDNFDRMRNRYISVIAMYPTITFKEFLKLEYENCEAD